jgi:hypothetical protein
MFKANNTIQNFFSYKDKIDKDLRSNIIYTLQCLDCKKNYIGKMTRHFYTRNHEHMTDKESTVIKHINETQKQMDWENMEI